MSTIVTRFSKCLTAIEYPKEKTSWNIAGIIKGKNAFCRFDVRDMFEMSDGTPAKKGRLDTKAEKMVFEEENDWVIFDMNELHKHVKKHKLKKVYLNDLIKTLEWNIRIKKWGT
tara:strand:+ start:134 stop:475 length:342 start_codon:yes stop_codon:yes gene_type:complete